MFKILLKNLLMTISGVHDVMHTRRNGRLTLFSDCLVCHEMNLYRERIGVAFNGEQYSDGARNTYLSHGTRDLAARYIDSL